MGNRKLIYSIIIGGLTMIAIGGYQSYWRLQKYAKHGVYTIAIVTKNRIARNGWKVSTSFTFHNNAYEFDQLVSGEVFHANDVSKRFFAKILENAPDDGCILAPVLQVPDSMVSAPSTGWSEDWMKHHFPKVVEYTYDRR